MARNFGSALADAIEYFQSIGPELYELEQKVKEIKNSSEYKKHSNIMKTYTNRDIIDVSPSFKNAYSIPNTIYMNGKEEKVETFLQKHIDNNG